MIFVELLGVVLIKRIEIWGFCEVSINKLKNLE
jgi:hypothetical protein